jgi:hypothetical protein
MAITNGRVTYNDARDDAYVPPPSEGGQDAPVCVDEKGQEVMCCGWEVSNKKDIHGVCECVCECVCVCLRARSYSPCTLSSVRWTTFQALTFFCVVWCVLVYVQVEPWVPFYLALASLSVLWTTFLAFEIKVFTVSGAVAQVGQAAQGCCHVCVVMCVCYHVCVLSCVCVVMCVMCVVMCAFKMICDSRKLLA